MPETPTKKLKRKFEEILDYARHEELLSRSEVEDLSEEIKRAVESSAAYWQYEQELGRIESNKEDWEWKEELKGYLSRMEGIIDEIRGRGTPLDMGSIMAELERLGFVNSENFPELYDQAMQKVRGYVANREES